MQVLIRYLAWTILIIKKVLAKIGHKRQNDGRASITRHIFNKKFKILKLSHRTKKHTIFHCFPKQLPKHYVSVWSCDFFFLTIDNSGHYSFMNFCYSSNFFKTNSSGGQSSWCSAGSENVKANYISYFNIQLFSACRT